MENTQTIENTDADHDHNELDRWDRFGLFLSGLCAVHCMVTPFLVAFMPLLAERFEAPWVHVAMALFVVPVGVYAFWSGFKHHHDKKILLIGLVGLLLVGGAALFPLTPFDLGHDHSEFSFFSEETVTIIGSFLLITAHLLNRRACACHSH